MATTVAAAVSGRTARGAEEKGWPTREALAAEYRRAMQFFRAALPEKLSTVPLEIEDDDWIDKRQPTQAGEEAQVYILKPRRKSGEVFGIMHLTSDGRVIEAGAHVNLRSAMPPHSVPKWSVAAAIESAASWLKRFGWELPQEFEIGDVEYKHDGSWQVRWHRRYGGVPELIDERSDFLTVLMEEDGTGLRFARQLGGPAPTSISAKLTRTEGVTLAAKALPAIMATRIYGSSMPKGLSPVDLRTAELRIIKPNWLLDPKRYSVAGPKGPPERRLCWYVVFMLQRQDKSERDGKPVFTSTFGLVHVYVDALSGEIVGGNMEPIFNDEMSRRFGNQ